MSVDARVRIIVEAVTSAAQADFQRLSQSMGSVTTAAQTGGRTIGQTLSGIRTSYLAVAGAVGGVANAARQAYSQTIGQTQLYAASVRDLSLVTNQSAESTSRLIQVADDFELTASDLTTAARMMRDQGLSPNVETLARLSDEFRSLQDPAARSQFLMENFGRAGAGFANLMDQGSDAIRERSDSISDGLVLTAEDIVASERLRLAQDDLNDSFRTISTTLSTALIPGLAALTSGLAQTISEHESGRSVWVELIQNIRDASRETEAATRAAIAQTEADRLLQESHYLSNRTWTLVEGSADRYRGTLDDIGAASDGAMGEMRLLSDEMLAQQIAASNDSGSMGLLRDSIESLRDRNLTVTVTTVRQEFVRQLQGSLQGGYAGLGATAHQHGGPFRGMALVGDPGPNAELVIGEGMVIPADETRRYLASQRAGGIRRLQKGGAFTGKTAPPPKKGAYIPPGGSTKEETTTGGTTTTEENGAGAEQAIEQMIESIAPLIAAIPGAAALAVTGPIREEQMEVIRSNAEVSGLLRDIREILRRQGGAPDMGRAVRDSLLGAGFGGG